MTRLRRAYRAVALVTLNTIVLFAVGLVLLDLLLPARAPRQPYSRYFGLDSYTRIPREQALAVGREFDAMGEQQSYEFDPWTLFRERAFQGVHVNVGEDGIRRTASPDARFAAREPLRVWAFGGSTLFGWGMPDSETVASHLQAQLQARLPGRQVRVTNLGHSYFFSSMELAYFLSLLRTREKPDVAVFLDGLNDGLNLLVGSDVPYFAAVLYDAWEEVREREVGAAGDRPWIRFNRSFPLFRLSERLQPEAGPRLFRVSKRYRKSPADPVAFAIRHFDTNRRAARAVGRELGIEILHFLQPARGVDPTGRSGRDDLPALYAALLGEPREGLHPIVDALDGLRTPYVDTLHYSDEGCFRVARAMAVALATRLDAAAGPP